MAKGVRKTRKEKLNQELVKTQEAIQGHKNAIKTLEEKLKSIQEEIKFEEVKELSTVLEDNHISITELKELIANKDKAESN